MRNTGAIKVKNICGWNLCTFQLDNEVEPLIYLLNDIKNMFILLQVAANSQSKNPGVGGNFKLVIPLTTTLSSGGTRSDLLKQNLSSLHLES